MTDLPATQPPAQQLTDASVDTPEHPIYSVDAAALTVLFDEDPSTISDVQLDALIHEYRRRADVNAAEAAAALLDAKKPKAKRGGNAKLIDAAMAAVADKPISEIGIADLFGDDL